MEDRLTITDLELWTRIGVSADERNTEQRLLVTVEMTLDTKAAAKSDDVKKTINYVDVSEDIRKLSTKERKTIERFAEDIAQMILKKYATSSVRVTVKKFPILQAKEISLTIVRKKLL